MPRGLTAAHARGPGYRSGLRVRNRRRAIPAADRPDPHEGSKGGQLGEMDQGHQRHAGRRENGNGAKSLILDKEKATKSAKELQKKLEKQTKNAKNKEETSNPRVHEMSESAVEMPETQKEQTPEGVLAGMTAGTVFHGSYGNGRNRESAAEKSQI